jgi:Ca2+-binding RTX toxin-like protein
LQFIDKVFGGSGDDVFTRGTFTSGQFSTFLEFEGLGGDDSFTGVVGRSTRISYLRSPAGVTVDLETGTAQDGFGGTDTITDIFQVRGSNFDDTLLGSNSSEFEQFRPRGGDDFIDGRGGAQDEVRYSGARTGVTIDLSAGATVTFADGFGGTDTITNIERLRGTNFRDNLTGDANDNRLTGQAGDDTLIGGGGADRLLGEDGNDFLDGGTGADTLQGGNGDDRLVFDAADATIDGGSGSDTLVVNDGGGRGGGAVGYGHADRDRR